MSKHQKTKKHSVIWIILLIFVLIILAVLVGFYFYISSKTDFDDTQDESIQINEDATIEHETGYQNIAIFGVDSRENALEDGTRSDSIIIASINNDTNEVKLCSIYRDTYVYIGDSGYTKINHAYAKGGYSLALSTINTNFDLDITQYITVNFYAVSKVIDLLGGITLDIQSEEVKWLNGYVKEINKVNDTNVSGISSAGTQTVNGTQALAYARIRYTSGGDFKRAERQRIVLDQIFEKAKSSNVTTLISIVNEMLPNISTNLSTSQILGLARDIMNYEIVKSDGFPFEKTASTYNGVSYVFPLNLSGNVTQLHLYLFDEDDYVPSSSVQEYSNYIESLGF